MALWEFWWLYEARKAAAGAEAPLTHDDIAEAQAFAAEMDAKFRKR